MANYPPCAKWLIATRCGLDAQPQDPTSRYAENRLVQKWCALSPQLRLVGCRWLACPAIVLLEFDIVAEEWQEAADSTTRSPIGLTKADTRLTINYGHSLGNRYAFPTRP